MIAGTEETALPAVALTGCRFSRVWGGQAGLKVGHLGASAHRPRLRGYLCLEVI